MAVGTGVSTHLLPSPFKISVHVHITELRIPLIHFWFLYVLFHLFIKFNKCFQLSHAYLDRVTQLSYDNEKTFDLWINETVANEWVHVDVPMYITRPFKVILLS